jgi:hypothetical protein
MSTSNTSTAVGQNSTSSQIAKTSFDVVNKTGELALKNDAKFSRNEKHLLNTVNNLASSNVSEREADALARQIVDAFGDGDITDDELDNISMLVSHANSSVESGSAGVKSAASDSSWTFVNNGDGTGTIDLGNYTVSLKESNYEWTVTDKTTGQQTRVWGDPHVDFQNDGDTDLDFKANLSLMLEDGTKITCETLPFGNGQTVSTKLVITNKDQAIEVTGLAAGMDADLNIKKIDDAAAAWDTSWGKTVVYQGNDGSWYGASGLLQQGSILDDGSLNLDKVDKSKRLEFDTATLFNGYYVEPSSSSAAKSFIMPVLTTTPIVESEEEVEEEQYHPSSLVGGFNDNYAKLYGNDTARATAVRDLLIKMGG